MRLELGQHAAVAAPSTRPIARPETTRAANSIGTPLAVRKSTVLIGVEAEACREHRTPAQVVGQSAEGQQCDQHPRGVGGEDEGDHLRPEPVLVLVVHVERAREVRPDQGQDEGAGEQPEPQPTAGREVGEMMPREADVELVQPVPQDLAAACRRDIDHTEAPGIRWRDPRMRPSWDNGPAPSRIVAEKLPTGP